MDIDWPAVWQKRGWPADRELTPEGRELMGVMADWLEEQGREAAAGWCRRAARGETMPWGRASWYDTEPGGVGFDPASDLGKALFERLGPERLSRGTRFQCVDGGNGVSYLTRAEAWQDFIRAVLKLEG